MGEVNTSIRKQYLIAACLYLGQLSIGYTIGWSAPVIALLQDPDKSPLSRAISDPEASWVASITFIGIIGGPYISGYLGNEKGRKSCLYFGGGMFVISYLILTLAKSLVMICIGRTLVGVGSGGLFVSNLVYIAELSSTRVRGTLLTLTGLFSSLGILLVYSVGPFVSFAAINGIALTLNAAYLVGIFFLVPETAIFQVMKGRKEEAMATLKSLGRHDDIDEVVAQANIKPKPKLAQLTELYTVKSNRRATFIIICLSILTQLSGMMAVIAFVTVIFDMTGSSMEPHVNTIIIGVTQVVASVIAPLLVDRTGRKVLLLVSCAACSLSLASLGTYFFVYNNDYEIADNLQWLSLVSVMVFYIAYYSGLGIVCITFIGEMFTDTCRGLGGTITVTIGFVFGFAVSTTFGYMLPVWGPSVVFWIFSGVCAVTFFFTVVFVPETKGKSLLEIRELLSR